MSESEHVLSSLRHDELKSICIPSHVSVSEEIQISPGVNTLKYQKLAFLDEQSKPEAGVGECVKYVHQRS